MLELVVAIVVVVGGVWAVAVFHLRGADLRAFDRPVGERFALGDAPGPEIGAVVASLGQTAELLRGVPMRRRNAVLRKYLDEMFAGRELGVQLVPADCGGVPGEWVLAPGADPRQLYEKLLKGYEVLKSSNIRARMSKYLICKSTCLRQSPEHSKRKLPRSRKLLNKSERIR